MIEREQARQMKRGRETRNTLWVSTMWALCSTREAVTFTPCRSESRPISEPPPILLMWLIALLCGNCSVDHRLEGCTEMSKIYCPVTGKTLDHVVVTPPPFLLILHFYLEISSAFRWLWAGGHPTVCKHASISSLRRPGAMFGLKSIYCQSEVTVVVMIYNVPKTDFSVFRSHALSAKNRFFSFYLFFKLRK